MARFGLLDSDDEHSDASSVSSDSARESQRSTSLPLSDDYLQDAPPRASLLSDEQDSESESESGSGSQDEEDHSMDQQTPSPPRRALPAPSRRAPQQFPWAQQLKLEPKRVQVMQASFFGQAPPHESDDHERLPKRRAVQPVTQPQPQPQAVATPVLDPAPFRPYRTYSRVPLADSIVRGAEPTLVDAGLALARSYRVGWGTKGEVITLNGVYDHKETQSDVLKLEKLRLLSEQESDSKAASLRLLEVQLAHTEISPSCHTDPSSSYRVPFASPLPTLRFHHFARLFTDPSSSSSSSDLETSPEAQYLKLASHLFDEISDLGTVSSLSYSPSSSSSSSPSYTSNLTRLRRRDLLSTWLSQSLLPFVSRRLSQPSVSPLEKVFLLLSTHDLSRACDLALESRNLRLSTLISQVGTISASGTDEQFQEDLELQIEKWREYKVEGHVSVETRRVYEVLSGNVGISKGRGGGGGGVAKEDESEEFHVLEGLEWKAAFAMGLWYSRNSSGGGGAAGGGGGDEEVERAMKLYEQGFKSDPSNVKMPLPSYFSSSSTPPPTPPTTRAATDRQQPLDPVFHLLKLYTCPTHPLEESLAPLNFGPSPTDYRLPWHLYLVFSRVLRKRDFEDRLQVDETRSDDGGMIDQEAGTTVTMEGNSVKADQMTVSYASQLESIGMWQWSVFVLLHLELDAPRAQAIQQVLTRNVAFFTPSLTSFLVETLHIPRFYLSRARATSSQSIGDVFGTYKHLISGLRTERAHEIAVEELCPEAIVRGDSSLVKRLLEPFREDRDEDEQEEENMRGTVQGWEQGGLVYLEYLSTLDLFSNDPTTLTRSNSAAAFRLQTTIQKVQGFEKRVRQVEKLKENWKLRMALSEMSSRLNVLSRVVGGKALSVTQPSLLGESEKLVWLQGATQSFLQSSLKRAGAV